MKATELRIGNLLRKNDGYSDIVVTIDARSIFDIDSYPAVMGIRYSPIPLTEEWLKRFGFQEKHVFEIVSEWSIGEHRLQCDGEIFIWMGYKDGIQLRFVHSLQNLFYCLCGSELEAKQKEG